MPYLMAVGAVGFAISNAGDPPSPTHTHTVGPLVPRPAVGPLVPQPVGMMWPTHVSCSRLVCVVLLYWYQWWSEESRSRNSGSGGGSCRRGEKWEVREQSRNRGKDEVTRVSTLSLVADIGRCKGTSVRVK